MFKNKKNKSFLTTITLATLTLAFCTPCVAASEQYKTAFVAWVKKSEQNITKIVHNLVQNRLSNEKLFNKEAKEKIIGDFVLKIEMRPLVENATNYFACRLYYKKGETKKEIGRIVFYLDKQINVHITWLWAHPLFRQLGIGRFLLSTLINALKQFENRTLIVDLDAAPEDPKMLTKLMEYYKSFGFIADKNSDTHKMKLTIKDGIAQQ